MGSWRSRYQISPHCHLIYVCMISRWNESATDPRMGARKNNRSSFKVVSGQLASSDKLAIERNMNGFDNMVRRNRRTHSKARGWSSRDYPERAPQRSTNSRHSPKLRAPGRSTDFSALEVYFRRPISRRNLLAHKNPLGSLHHQRQSDCRGSKGMKIQEINSTLL